MRRLRGCSVKLQSSLKVGIQDTLVFLICLMCWGGRLFLKGDMRLDLFCFTKLLTVWHKCPSKAYKVTRRKHYMKFRQIGHTTSQYGQSLFLKLLVHEMGLLSLKISHWLYLDQIFLRTDTGLKIFFFKKCIIYRYYYIKRLVVTSLEDITPKKNYFLHGGHLE